MIFGFAVKDSTPIPGTDRHLVEVVVDDMRGLFILYSATEIVQRSSVRISADEVSTETIAEVLKKAAEEALPSVKPEEKETPEDIKRRARKPPTEGPCRGCGKNLPLNRLMLCFKCWVNKNLSDWAKAKGRDFIPNIDPHPAWCGCGLPEHGGKLCHGN